MSVTLILVVLLVIILLGAIPAWPHAAGWGWGPSGFVGVILVVLVILLVLGKI